MVQYDNSFPFKEERLDILNYFYDLKITNDHFLQRKLVLPEDRSFVLTGARGVGKSTLVIDYLQALPADTWLYIDCQDPIFALEDIDGEDLETFIRDASIETLVLDHYYEGFVERLPQCFQVILVGRDRQIAETIPERFELFPLDYEEFLSFERGSTSAPATQFSHFLKAGTLPGATTTVQGALSQYFRHFFYANFDEDESRLMLILARYQGQRITIHQLYTYAKESFRISKDWIYKTVKRFTQEGLILFVEDHDIKGAKKMILYDFALSKYLSKSQPFPVTFDAIIVLALAKHRIPFRSIGLHGYRIPQDELIVPSPFEGEEQFWKKAYNKIALYKQHKITRVTIVTVSNRYHFSIGNIVFEALPFYEWSIVNEE
jgi:predicted AAA+ superfamily ATPase